MNDSRGFILSTRNAGDKCEKSTRPSCNEAGEGWLLATENGPRQMGFYCAKHAQERREHEARLSNPNTEFFKGVVNGRVIYLPLRWSVDAEH